MKLAEDHLDTNEKGVKALHMPYVIEINKDEIVNAHISTLPEHNANEKSVNEQGKETVI